MKLLARYLFNELLLPLGAWVVFLFVLLFVMQFLRGTDVLLGSAITAQDLGRLMLYLSPHFLVMALPVAFLLAVLLGLGRLSEDRELVALQALGVGPWQLLAAPLLISLLLGGVMLLLSFTAEPWGLTAVKGLVSEVIKKNVVGDVKAGVFYEDLSNLTLYAEKVDARTKVWTHVLIHDARDPSAPLLVLAHQGKVQPGGAQEALRLSLNEGEAHRVEHLTQDASRITFERGEIAVGAPESLNRRNRFRSPKEELTPGELLRAAEDARKSGQSDRSFLMALHSRMGLALAPLAFAFLGTPLALRSRQAGKARGYVLTLAGYVSFYMLTRVFENLGLKGYLPLFVAGQLANALFMGLGLISLSRLSRAGS